MTGPTIFERIANEKGLGHVIWEGDFDGHGFIAFLDINPLQNGHTLVVPKKNHGDYIFELDDDVYSGLMKATKEVAKLLKAKIGCERILMWVEGFEVPHVHVHLIPATDNFKILEAEIMKVDKKDLEYIQQKILN